MPFFYSPPGYYHKNPCGISPLTWIFFLPFTSMPLFGKVLGVHLAPLTKESSPPTHLKALPHAHITSSPFNYSPLLWQVRKSNVKEDLEARELCRR